MTRINHGLPSSIDNIVIKNDTVAATVATLTSINNQNRLNLVVPSYTYIYL